MKAYIERLKEIMRSYKTHYFKILARQENSELLEFINKWYNFPAGTKLRTKIFWVLNDIHIIPKCRNCGVDMPINAISYKTNRYCDYCGNKCATGSAERNEKRRMTNNLKYGGNAPVCSSVVKEKMRQTCIERYGVDCSFKSDDVKRKISITNIKRYGVPVSMQSDAVKNKGKATCLKKYGCENGGYTEEAKAKIEATCMEKYGVKYAYQADKVKAKIAKTMVERYGINTMLKHDSVKANNAKRVKERSFDEFILHNEYDEPLFSREYYIEHHSYANDIFFKLPFRCKRCGTEFMSAHKNGYHDKCPKCFPPSVSAGEVEVFEFIKSIYGGNIVHREGSFKIIPPYQLDMYIPEKRLAIEFDGIYWHSEDKKPGKAYHLNKTELCEKRGIQLIHVFENEWLHKRNIVKSRIKNLLGVYDNVVYARECYIERVSSNTAVEFLNENHIQGRSVAALNIGLYSNRELVAIMAFGKCRFDKRHEWEMLRFCCKLGYRVPGAAGRLLKYFERNYRPKSLVSYADRRWSNGKLYKALGFSFSHASSPNYWYFKSNLMKLESRLKYQKHKLRDILEKFDENKTEAENMKANGYYRIFDCGNLVFEKTYES